MSDSGDGFSVVPRSKWRSLIHSLRHLAKDTRLLEVRHVDEDIIRRVAVQRRTQTLLVEVVANETD